MTDMNGTPVPDGSTPGPGQPTAPQPLQPTQPTAPVPPQNTYQPYGGQAQAHAAGQHAYGQQPPYGAQQTYEAEPVSVHPQHGGQKSSGGKTFLIAFAGALVACVLAFGVWGVANAMGGIGKTETVTDPVTGQQTVIAPSEDATLAETVSAKCLPSVVAIDVYAAPQQGSMGGWAELFGYDYGYGTDQGQDGQELEMFSQGSGVVLTEDGYIITNNHVVEGGSAYKVTVGGNTYDAELVGTDPSSDVAVLKAKDAKGLTVMEVGDSDNLTIGEWVMTLGSPFGLEQSVATGIVSATSRSQIMDAQESVQSGGSGEITIYPNMIQTDAAINPGNSGGALVDAEGKLIGINTLITSYSGNYSGVGFAIPVNYAINLAQQIIAGETPTHAQLGVSLSSVNAQSAKRYGLSVDTGAYVAGVAEGSGAAAAGIVPGDIITAFDGQPVESASDLMLDVRTKNPGDTVTLTVNSGGQSKDVQVTLGDDAASQQQKAETQQESMDEFQQGGRGGMSLEDMLRLYDQHQQKNAA